MAKLHLMQRSRAIYRPAVLATLAIAGALVLGCTKPASEEAPSVVVPSLTPANVAPNQVSADDHASANAPSPALALTPVATSDNALANDYQPPFPDRVDLFVPPKRPAGSATEATQQNSVALMGFVRVDRQRVVLSIDGNVASIPAGETQFGVQVLSIQPPNVELQRGRQRWHATLE